MNTVFIVLSFPFYHQDIGCANQPLVIHSLLLFDIALGVIEIDRVKKSKWKVIFLVLVSFLNLLVCFLCFYDNFCVSDRYRGDKTGEFTAFAGDEHIF